MPKFGKMGKPYAVKKCFFTHRGTVVYLKIRTFLQCIFLLYLVIFWFKWYSVTYRCGIVKFLVLANRSSAMLAISPACLSPFLVGSPLATWQFIKIMALYQSWVVLTSRNIITVSLAIFSSVYCWPSIVALSSF